MKANNAGTEMETEDVHRETQVRQSATTTTDDEESEGQGPSMAEPALYFSFRGGQMGYSTPTLAPPGMDINDILPFLLNEPLSSRFWSIDLMNGMHSLETQGVVAFGYRPGGKKLVIFLRNDVVVAGYLQRETDHFLMSAKPVFRTSGCTVSGFTLERSEDYHFEDSCLAKLGSATNNNNQLVVAQGQHNCSTWCGGKFERTTAQPARNAPLINAIPT